MAENHSAGARAQQDPFGANAYALNVLGGWTQIDQIMPGDQIVVNPEAPVKIGDIVVVRMGDGRRSLRKLIRRTRESVILRAFGSRQVESLQEAKLRMHKIVCILPKAALSSTD